jgi:hypothetical protein
MATVLAFHERHYFMGFERSQKFEDLWRRLEQLEKWKELAIRPEPIECDPDDLIFLEKDVDDVAELQKRCETVRRLMNEILPPIEKRLDDDLIPKSSNIPNAGLGLFYQPSSSSNPISKGTILCYYTGHIHNFQSARLIKDTSYLMMVQGDVLVDPGPMKHIKARYINDPLNENIVNCKFVPDAFRSAVIATKEIRLGEEIFVAYGDTYWSGHDGIGTHFVLSTQKNN